MKKLTDKPVRPAIVGLVVLAGCVVLAPVALEKHRRDSVEAARSDDISGSPADEASGMSIAELEEAIAEREEVIGELEAEIEKREELAAKGRELLLHKPRLDDIVHIDGGPDLRPRFGIPSVLRPHFEEQLKTLDAGLEELSDEPEDQPLREALLARRDRVKEDLKRLEDLGNSDPREDFNRNQAELHELRLRLLREELAQRLLLDAKVQR